MEVGLLWLGLFWQIGVFDVQLWVVGYWVQDRAQFLTVVVLELVLLGRRGSGHHQEGIGQTFLPSRCYPIDLVHFFIVDSQLMAKSIKYIVQKVGVACPCAPSPRAKEPQILYLIGDYALIDNISIESVIVVELIDANKPGLHVGDLVVNEV